jgi:hypothetical protein
MTRIRFALAVGAVAAVATNSAVAQTDVLGRTAPTTIDVIAAPVADKYPPGGDGRSTGGSVEALAPWGILLLALMLLLRRRLFSFARFSFAQFRLRSRRGTIETPNTLGQGLNSGAVESPIASSDEWTVPVEHPTAPAPAAIVPALQDEDDADVTVIDSFAQMRARMVVEDQPKSNRMGRTG